MQSKVIHLKSLLAREKKLMENESVKAEKKRAELQEKRNLTPIEFFHVGSLRAKAIFNLWVDVELVISKL